MQTTINKSCVMCGTNYDINVNSEDFIAWKQGAFIQDVMGYLTADERELLISGVCGTCFNAMYGEEDDECSD